MSDGTVVAIILVSLIWVAALIFVNECFKRGGR